MANKQKGKKGKNGQGPVRRRRNRRGRAGGMNGEGIPAVMSEYDHMIRDPCAAPMTKAPYAGGVSGYVARFTASVIPPLTAPSGVVGSATKCSFAACFQPSSFPGWLLGGTSGGVNTSFTQLSVAGTFLSNSAVKEFRPLAACLKWVPNGAIQTRSGLISMGYSQVLPKSVGATGTTADIQNFANNGLERATNGSTHHEVRFLPAPNDENFNAVTPTLFSNAGTQFCVGLDVDSTYTAATVVQPNGILEFTVIVEWVPEGGQGLSVAPECTLPFTSQMYQSTIPDVGSFLLNGVRNAATTVGYGLARGATQSFLNSVATLGTVRRYNAGFALTT